MFLKNRTILQKITVGLSNILDSIGMEEFRRREPVKRAHRYIVGAILVCS